MKSLSLSVLVLYTSLVGFFGVPDSEKLTSPNIPFTEFSSPVDSYSEHVFSEDSTHKKAYNIYFENRSVEKIQVAIRYKEYSGKWITDGFETLEPGQKKFMGRSDEQTYFFYASTNKRIKKREWKGKYKFALNESSRNKVGFVKQDIWECYDTNSCNAFAVFK